MFYRIAKRILDPIQLYFCERGDTPPWLDSLYYNVINHITAQKKRILEDK